MRLKDIFLTEAAMILGLVKKFVDKLVVMLDCRSIKSDVKKLAQSSRKHLAQASLQSNPTVGSPNVT